MEKMYRKLTSGTRAVQKGGCHCRALLSVSIVVDVNKNKTFQASSNVLEPGRLIVMSVGFVTLLIKQTHLVFHFIIILDFIKSGIDEE